MTDNLPALPIDALRGLFLQQLKTHHLVVEADTGSGKSTRLPVWASQEGAVLVVEPRRVACLALAEYVAELVGTSVGEKVGYAIRFDSRCSSHTEIVFVTPGVALRWLAEGALQQFSTVIIDEFHERRWDTDLLLALLKKQNKLRVVLTSATIDGKRLAEYLEGKRLHATGRSFPVSCRYISEDSRRQPGLNQLDHLLPRALEQALRETSGDILIFMPGKREIQQTISVLGNTADQYSLALIPLHGSVSSQAQHQALAIIKQRRVIVATNVAETSLTIPGITAVIDSGLERRTHQRNGRTVLGLHSISMASAKQRQGRAGRVSAGLCLRLWGKNAPLEPLTPPELLREELVEPMLAAACCGYRLGDLTFVDRLPQRSLEHATLQLQKMKAINNEGQVTSHGQQLYPLPIDTLFAHLITAMPDQSCREAMVDLTAALSIGQRLWRMPGSIEGRQALSRWVVAACDALTLIRLIRSEPPEELQLDTILINEARSLAEQLRQALALPVLAEVATLDHKRWLEAVLQALPELAFIRRSKRRQALGNGFSELMVGRESRFADDAEVALVFDQHRLPGKGIKQTLTIATCMAPITIKDLIKAGVGEVRWGDSRWFEGTLQRSMERYYAGRLLEQVWQPVTGPLLQEALAKMILDDQLLAPAGSKLKQDIAAWNLYIVLEEAQSNAQAVNDLPWLIEKLQLLGVEQSEDVELIGIDDLCFEGIPEWKREGFDERYPQQLSLGDLLLAVAYEPQKKRVTLEKIGGLRKTDPKRRELPRWAGWQVRFRKASRVITL